MKYVKKLEIVEAVKYERGIEDGFMEMAGESVPYIDTTHGFQNIVEDGDYIVTHSDGHRQCVPAEVFESIYTACQKSSCMLCSSTDRVMRYVTKTDGVFYANYGNGYVEYCKTHADEYGYTNEDVWNVS